MMATRRGRLTVIPPVDPAVLLRAPAPEQTLPYPLGEPGCQLYASASSALLEGLASLGLSDGDDVLVPALHRGPEVDVLRLAGLRLRFYGLMPGLAPDEAQLQAMMQPGTRALYLIHHLGFAQDVDRWRDWCGERGLLLLEDATQAWTASHRSRAAGSAGSLAVFSLVQCFGLPEGAALIVKDPPAQPTPCERFGLPGLARGYSRWLAQRTFSVARCSAETGRGPGCWSGRSMEGAPSEATMRLIARVVDARAAPRRSAHYSVLLETLADRVPAPFGCLPQGAAPLGFPISDDGDGRLSARLAASGVEGWRPWRAAGGDLAEAFPADAALRRRTLVLPVHQQLRPADLRRVIAAVSGSRSPAHRELALSRIDLPDEPDAQWDALALASGSVFATHEWIATWWRHFGDGQSLHLIACHAPDGRLVAILPLCTRRRGGLRLVRFVGHGPSDACGPICAAADRPATARALRRQLHAMRADLLLGEQVSASQGWDALLGATVLRREASPVLCFHDTTWKALLARWGSNIRQQVGRLTRKLEREHGLSYRVTTSPENLAADVDTLLGLHEARWAEEQTAFTRHAGFHRDFAEVAMRRGWLRLLLLELDGQPAAGQYNFRYAGSETYYQSGRDPAWSQRPVGVLVLTEAIRLALEDRMREFRFGRGDESYKFRLANADPGLHTFGIARGVAAHAALAGLSVVPADLAKRVRRRVEGEAAPPARTVAVGDRA